MITQPRGPFAAGDQVQLTDPKGRQHRLVLTPGKSFHTHRGALPHDDLIGQPEGSVVTSAGGTPYIAFRPLLADYALSMPRGAAVVYPKDAAQIVGLADIFPGARVVEAGAGSGALSCWLLRAVGEQRQRDLLRAAGRTSPRSPRPTSSGSSAARIRPGSWSSATWMPPGWPARTCRRRPGRAGHAGAVGADVARPPAVLMPGGLVCCYVATTTQLARTVSALREQGNFAEPAAWETLQRGWHVDGLAVRPEHRMIGHTGFLVTARRLADGVTAPPRRRRPSKGAEAAEAEICAGGGEAGLADAAGPSEADGA